MRESVLIGSVLSEFYCGNILRMKPVAAPIKQLHFEYIKQNLPTKGWLGVIIFF